MDECRDGRGAGHGVGQPDVERICALLPAAEQQQQADDRGRGRRQGVHRFGQFGEDQRATVDQTMIIARIMPKSPARLTMKAFLPQSAYQP